MPWIGWMVIGAVLLGAELFFVEADFYLVFLGLSAMFVGLTGLVVPSLQPWMQWLLYAGVALVSMGFFRQRVYQRLRGNRPDMRDDLVGRIVKIEALLPPGESCRVEDRGSTWTVRNDGATPIGPDGKARVVGNDGIVLRVERLDQ